MSDHVWVRTHAHVRDLECGMLTLYCVQLSFEPRPKDEDGEGEADA
jgi:hypothetical protein